jgi:hypothetical protein
MYRGGLTVDGGSYADGRIVITYIKSNRNSLEGRAEAYWSSRKKKTSCMKMDIMKLCCEEEYWMAVYVVARMNFGFPSIRDFISHVAEGLRWFVTGT